MVYKKIIVWFRFDLRVADNPALHAAALAGEIIPVYIFDKQAGHNWKMSDAALWWLEHSLQELSAKLDGHLHCYHGDTVTVLESLIASTGADALYFNNMYEPWAFERDQKIKNSFSKKNIEVKSFQGSLLWDQEKMVKVDGSHYKVFTPFFNRLLADPVKPRAVLPALKKINFATFKDKKTSSSFVFLEKNIEHADRFKHYWFPGEKYAIQQLKQFIKHGLADYKVGRDFPAQNAVSRLSPYLRFGEISPSQIWEVVHDLAFEFASRENVQHFLKELCWREFAYHVLIFNPTMPSRNLHEKFDRFDWQYDQKSLHAWQMGMTGYPLVDAAMRELYNTGYMHNRMRMVTASFLVKNLMIEWQKGEAWFWEFLLDADLESNSFNWQWVAGSGYDAAPYFRIFNPTLQAEKFDPKGEYIKRWLPELAKLPLKYLFEPWTAPEHVLKSAEIVLGKTYPKPIVEIALSRSRALASFKKI